MTCDVLTRFLNSDEDYNDDTQVEYKFKKPILTLTAENILYTLAKIANKSIDPQFVRKRKFPPFYWARHCLCPMVCLPTQGLCMYCFLCLECYFEFHTPSF